MGCDGWQRIACSLERIATGSERGPGTYEVFAEIVIPLFVGVGTLALAVASVYVAYKSHVSQKRATDRAEVLQHRSERTQIGAIVRQLVLALAAKRIGMEAATTQESAAYISLVLNDEISASTQANASELLQDVQELVREIPGERNDDADALASELSAAALVSMRAWVKEPEQWLATKDTRVERREARLRPLRADYVERGKA